MMTETNTPETDLLFQHFATLATGPDGIARLRELILQLAVQGKLGTQDEMDEPASVLLERIRKEKERLVKEGKIKISGKNTVMQTFEYPFSTPHNWQWIQLGELTQKIGSGSTPKGGKAIYQRDGVKFIRSQNVWNDGLYLDNVARIPITIHQEMGSTSVQAGDILLNITGASIGRSCIVPEIFDEANVSQHVSIIRTLIQEIKQYIHFCIISPYFQKRIMDVQVGMSREGLSKKVLKDLLIPLPPLAEQHRIVEKVDRLMALCDELEKKQKQERSTCLQLGTASFAGLQNAESPEEFERQWAQICDTFDLMLDCPENVAVLRQTILQLAVQGKLGTQDEGDEPASVLLERIRGEKERRIKDGTLRKEKPLKYLNGDTTPFTLPKEWLWTYFGEITFNRDGERIPIEKAERETRPGIYDYYGASGVIDTIDDYLFDKPLLLIGEDGANLINRSTPIAFIAIGKYWVNNHAHVIDGISLEFLRYLEIYINSIDLKPYITGMAQPKLNQAKLNSIPIPLPPLAEQHRIVEKVDRLMALCDQLEAQLKNRAGVQERFAKAVVGGIAT